MTTSETRASRASETPHGHRGERARRDVLRTVKILMLFRVGLATILLVGAAAIEIGQGTPEELSGPYARFAFSLIGVTYLATLGYAIAFRRVRDPARFAFVQIGGDLALTTVVVHGTGGGQSSFLFLYLISVVTVALLARRRMAAIVAAVSVVLMLGVTGAGFFRLLPLVPGQVLAPWAIAPSELVMRLMINIAALAAVGVLASMLAARSRQADERLTRHEAYAGDLARLHENTIRCLTSGLVTLNLEGRVTSVNDAGCEILGCGRLGEAGPQLLGVPLASLLPDLPRVLAQAGPTGIVRRAEIMATRADGELRHVGISAAPLSDHRGQHIGRVIHFQDLTELRRMEVAVARAERLASIGRLAAAIAHEIRNPLAGISGSIELLRDHPGTEDENRKLMGIVVREVDRLNGLITSLLDYARPRTEERTSVDLSEDVSEVVAAFEHERRQVNAAIAVTAHVEAGTLVHGGRAQLRQVVWNLLRNAAEAMPSGGRIDVRVVREAGTRLGPMVLLAITDTGAGIPKADLDRIFEPFFSTKPGGTGLGLPTVARIIDDHRGTIELASEVGRGTTVTIRIPAVAVAAVDRVHRAA